MTIVDQQDKVIIHESLKYNVPTCALFLQAWLHMTFNSSMFRKERIVCMNRSCYF